MRVFSEMRMRGYILCWQNELKKIAWHLSQRVVLRDGPAWPGPDQRTQFQELRTDIYWERGYTLNLCGLSRGALFTGHSSGYEVKTAEFTWESDPGSGRSFLHPSVWNSSSNLESALIVYSTATPPGNPTAHRDGIPALTAEVKTCFTSVLGQWTQWWGH